MPALTKLKIAIKTGSEIHSGTDASIYLLLGNREGKTWSYLLPTRQEDLEAGKLDIYQVQLAEGPALEDLHSILLVNGMTGINPGWRILWVKLDVADESGRAWRVVDCMLERWLDTKPGRCPAAFLPLKQPFESLGNADAVGHPTTTLRSMG